MMWRMARALCAGVFAITFLRFLQSGGRLPVEQN
jgi:hypothetical protein